MSKVSVEEVKENLTCSTCPKCNKKCLTDYNYVNIKCANHTKKNTEYFACDTCKSCHNCLITCHTCRECTYCISKNNIHLGDVKYQDNFFEIIYYTEDDHTSYCHICFEEVVEEIPKYQTLFKLYLESLLGSKISGDVINIICKYYFERYYKCYL